MPANASASSAATTSGLAEHGVSEGHVDAERLAVKLPRELALAAETKPLVLQAIILNLGMVSVGIHLEGHEVAEVPTAGVLQSGEHVLRRAHHSQVDVLRGAGALESELEHKPALERRGIAEHRGDAGEETVEHQELPLAREKGPRLRRRPEPLLEGLREGFRGGVRAGGHAASPPKGASAFLTATSSAFLTRPRRSACCAACFRNSGESPARAQSFSVRVGLVVGTAPNQARSASGTSS